MRAQWVERVRELWRSKVVHPVIAQLRSGEGVDRLAQSAAAGGCVSIFPLFGASTGLGLLIGQIFKLNHVLLQVTNYAFTSLQILLLVPYYALGRKLFGLAPIPLDPMGLKVYLIHDPLGFLKNFWLMIFGAILIWAMSCIPLFGILFYLMRGLLKRVERRVKAMEMV